MKRIFLLLLAIFTVITISTSTGCLLIDVAQSLQESEEPGSETNQGSDTLTAQETSTSTENNPVSETKTTRDTGESENLIMFYSTDADFAFVYPQDDLTLSSDQYIRGDYGNMILSVQVQKIEDLTGETNGYDSQTAWKDMEELADGSFGQDIDFVFGPSKHVLKIGDSYVKDFIVFGRFDVCDVTFERKAIFYNNGYQIIISLRADRDKVMESMDQYFIYDSENCGNRKIWNIKKQKDFYNILAAGQGSGPAQEWYDTFNSITGLLQINEYKGASAGYNRIIDKRIYENDNQKNYMISAAYPEFQFAVSENSVTLSDLILNDSVMPAIDSFKIEVGQMNAADDQGEGTLAFNYLLIIDYSIVMYNEDIVSLSINLYPYIGGAHGMYSYQTYNFDMGNNKSLGLADIFKPEFDYKKFLSGFCYADIIDQQEKMDVQPDTEWVKRGTDPADENNYSSFLFTPEGLIIKFLSYQVAPGAAGDFSVKIPYSSFKENISPESVIYKIAGI